MPSFFFNRNYQSVVDLTWREFLRCCSNLQGFVISLHTLIKLRGVAVWKDNGHSLFSPPLLFIVRL